MPKISQPTPPRFLQVRKYIWPCRDGGPPVEMLVGNKWKACHSLDDARRYAERHGYKGIRVTPL